MVFFGRSIQCHSEPSASHLKLWSIHVYRLRIVPICKRLHATTYIHSIWLFFRNDCHIYTKSLFLNGLKLFPYQIKYLNISADIKCQKSCILIKRYERTLFRKTQDTFEIRNAHTTISSIIFNIYSTKYTSTWIYTSNIVILLHETKQELPVKTMYENSRISSFETLT